MVLEVFSWIGTGHHILKYGTIHDSFLTKKSCHAPLVVHEDKCFQRVCSQHFSKTSFQDDKLFFHQAEDKT